MARLLHHITTSPSKTLLAFCSCFLAGIVVASYTVSERGSFVFIYFLLIVSIGFLILYWRDVRVRFLFLCMLCGIGGYARYMYAFPGTQDVSFFHEREVSEFHGYIADEPDMRIDGVRYIIALMCKEDQDCVRGRMYISSGIYPRYEYGDKVTVSCKLKTPEPIVGDDGRVFRYDRYLARYGVFVQCQQPIIKKENGEEGSRMFRMLLSGKHVFARQVETLWPEPYAGFMSGLLYGYRGGLGSLDQKFAVTGVSHMVAISGYNITIIVTLLMGAMVRVRIPRKKAFWMTVCGIVFFVIGTGASASVVRAGIMGVVALVATHVGRKGSVGHILLFTAVLMNLANPFVLLWDAGFQLSFLATVGLVYLSPLLQPFVREWRAPGVLAESFVSTMSAIIATLPLTLYQFGRLSLVAPFVNVLVLWTIPYVMGSGFVSVLLHSFVPALGDLVAWIPYVGMRYIVSVVSWFASVRYASMTVSIPWWVMVSWYILLIWYVLNKRKRMFASRI